MSWLSKQCILAPLNIPPALLIVLVAQLPGDFVECRSLDSVPDEYQAAYLPTEFLNSLEVSGIPSHLLSLKVTALIIILQSLDPPRVTNGTRRVIMKLSANTIESRISYGRYASQDIIIPRIPLILSNSTLPCDLRRLQFPVALFFAMTIGIKAWAKLSKL